MEGMGYYYDHKIFLTIEAAIERHKTQTGHSVGAQLRIIYRGVLVGNIDINRLGAEVSKHASGR